MSLCKKVIETEKGLICEEKACLRHTSGNHCFIRYKGPPRYSNEEDIARIESNFESSGLYPPLDAIIS